MKGKVSASIAGVGAGFGIMWRSVTPAYRAVCVGATLFGVILLWAGIATGNPAWGLAGIVLPNVLATLAVPHLERHHSVLKEVITPLGMTINVWMAAVVLAVQVGYIPATWVAALVIAAVYYMVVVTEATIATAKYMRQQLGWNL